MSAPFEKFIVRRGWLYGTRFIVDVEPPVGPGATEDEGRDVQTDRRRFIEAAIREKLERERKP